MIRKCKLAVVVALLSGCGAETAVVAIGYIAPIGGDFTQDTDLSTPQLEAGAPKKFINIQIGDGWDQFYDTKFEVTGTTNLDGFDANCTAFTGLVSERSITSFIPGTQKVCFKGSFRNESTLELSDGRRLLRNFPLNLDSGSWVNINDVTQIFKFDRIVGNTFSGCEIAGSQVTPVIGEFISSDIDNGVLASIKSLVVQRASGTQLFTGQFEGASGIRLSSNGKQILLQRQKNEVLCQ